MLDELREIISSMMQDVDYSLTAWSTIKHDSNGDWAIVFGWMDYDGNGEYKLYGKVAYLPSNSVMSEYDIDWLMPSDKDENVIDTEVEITDEMDLNWLIAEAKILCTSKR